MLATRVYQRNLFRIFLNRFAPDAAAEADDGGAVGGVRSTIADILGFRFLYNFLFVVVVVVFAVEMAIDAAHLIGGSIATNVVNHAADILDDYFLDIGAQYADVVVVGCTA